MVKRLSTPDPDSGIPPVSKAETKKPPSLSGKGSLSMNAALPVFRRIMLRPAWLATCVWTERPLPYVRLNEYASKPPRSSDSPGVPRSS
jgi:hypothetical protein